MVFRRRNPRTLLAWARALVYPEGGFRRATQYVLIRMRRLPDAPHKVARGVFAGTFVNFPPIFGFQFIGAALFAWAIRGNILAALFCTFLSNPLTTPIIALVSLELGYWMMGIDEPLNARNVARAFGDAGLELWRNARAIFTSDVTRWESLGVFFRTIYLPYTVGSILPGIVVSLAAYLATIPIVTAYQRLRARRLRERVERRMAERAAALARSEAALRAGEGAQAHDAAPPGADGGRPPG